jgi:hypothetical protein
MTGQVARPAGGRRRGIILVGTGLVVVAALVAACSLVTDDLSKASAIAAGSDHTCAVLSYDRIKCWGHNGSGQLGDGTTEDRHAPVVVTGIMVAGETSIDVRALAAGGNHTCAVAVGGSVWCWGDNKYGELGDGTTVEDSTPVEGIHSGVHAIAAGSGHTCVVLANCSVRCWGSNNSGQLGDGTTEDRHTDVIVIGIEGGCMGPRKARPRNPAGPTAARRRSCRARPSPGSGRGGPRSPTPTRSGSG